MKTYTFLSYDNKLYINMALPKQTSKLKELGNELELKKK